MSVGEFVLTFLVALIVFGPKKLPVLAQHLGWLFARFYRYKRALTLFWQQQLNEQLLRDNIKKAEKAD